MTELTQRLLFEEIEPILAQRLPAFEKAASDNWYVGQSDVAGQGVFAGKDYEPGDVIDVSMVDGGQNEWGSKIWNLTALSRYCNHQTNNNVAVQKDGDKFNLVAVKPISQDDELFANYREVTRSVGPGSRMQWEGKDIPTSDLADYLEKEAVAKELQGFIDRSELMGSRGRALKYGRPEPEDRDYDRVVFTDDVKDQQNLMQVLRTVAELQGFKQHERPGGFLTVSDPSGPGTDLSVYPTAKRDDIHKAWDLIEGGMSKDEAWDLIEGGMSKNNNDYTGKEAAQKKELYHSCCGKPAGECSGCPGGSVLIEKEN